MKYSSAPRHFAPHKKVTNNKNSPGHKSRGGMGAARKKNITAELVRLLFGKLSRRTRRVFMEQERNIK